jgi:plasmid stabilization system protein ParE
MNYHLVIDPAAQQDVLDASLWYEDQRPGLGAEFLDAVENIVHRIADAPLQFPVVYRDQRRGLTRRFPYGIYFEVSEYTVRVRAVLHLSRRPDLWRRRTEQ